MRKEGVYGVKETWKGEKKAKGEGNEQEQSEEKRWKLESEI